MTALVQDLSLSSLLAHTQALIDKYLLPSVDLHDEAKHNWNEIETSRGHFEIYNRKAKYLQDCLGGGTQGRQALREDLALFCDHFFVSDASSRVLMVTAGHT